MNRPTLLLLDEPSLGLSPILVKEIFAIIRRVNEEQGMSILLVEQNAKVALETAHYGYVLEIGRVVMNDTCERLMHSKDIQEFYLGAKEAGRAGRTALEKEENVALNDGLRRSEKDRLSKPASEAGRDEGGNEHGRTGSADGRRHDREEFSAARRRRAATGRRSARRSSASGSRPAGGSGCRFRRKSPTDCMPSASGRATSPRSSPTRCRNGCLPIWASCAPAAFRPESIRPIPPSRWNISSMTPLPG